MGSKMKNISTSKRKSKMLHNLVQTCPNLSKLVQTCLKISIQMTSVFSHFHKNSEHMLFSTRTLTILLKKSSSKTTKKNYQTKQILLLIPPFHPSIIPNNFNATIYLLFPKSQLFICVFNITSMKKEKKFGNIYQQITKKKKKNRKKISKKKKKKKKKKSTLR